jgi:hypothetical protein
MLIGNTGHATRTTTYQYGYYTDNEELGRAKWLVRNAGAAGDVYRAARKETDARA